MILKPTASSDPGRRPPHNRASLGDHSLTGGRNDPMTEILERLMALEAALEPLGATPELRAALDRLQVSCAEQAAALDHFLHQPHPSWAPPGSLLRRLPVPALQLTHALHIVDWNMPARELLGGRGNETDVSLLRRMLSRKEVHDLMRVFNDSLALPPGRPPASAPPLRLKLMQPDAPRRAFLAHVVGVPMQAERDQATWWLVMFPVPTGQHAGNPELLRYLIDSSADPLLLTDPDGRVVITNTAYSECFGCNPADIEGRARAEFMEADLAQHFDGLEAEVIAKRTTLFTEELAPAALLESSSQPANLWTERRPVFDDEGEVVGVFTRARDMTEELRIREVERLADRVFEQSTDAIVVTDPALRVLRVNPAFETMSGISPTEARGRQLDTLVATRSGLALQRGPTHWLGAALARDGGVWQGEVVMRGRDGRKLSCWARVTQLTDESGIPLGHVAMLADVTLLRQAQADNQRMAHFDLLTGLANRRLLADRIDDWIGYASRAGKDFALMYLDLNKFKSVNDSLGHETGDLLLTMIADRLRGMLRESELAARIGGDEFVVLMGNTDEAAALRRAASLLEQLALPLDLPGLHNYVPSASAGIACFGRHGDSRDVLLRNSDLAMYAAKSARTAVMFYEDAMGAEARHEFETRVALLNALENDEFELHFQPIFGLSDKQPRGCEALVRWNRPGHGLVMPGEFLPVAAKAGLMPAIDRLVLRRAVAVQARWRWAGLVHADWTLSINQTASSLAAPDWAEALEAALVRVGWKTTTDVAPPFGLQIELTEDQLALDLPGAMAALTRLRPMGIALAIDDFGTGYSSLTYLRRMPVTTLKIDASFVKGIEADGDARQIVEAIIGLAKKFGFVALAEGIECEAALQTLIDLGCDLGQGYLFERPLSQDVFEARFFGTEAREVPNAEAVLRAAP